MISINYILNLRTIWLSRVGNSWGSNWHDAIEMFRVPYCTYLCGKIDKKLKLFSDTAVYHIDRLLRSDYVKVAVPVFISGMLWAISVPMQTAILGHLSSDAIAANSVASTFYQYMKVVVLAMSSASSVMMGKAVGRGDLDEVKSRSKNALCT